MKKMKISSVSILVLISFFFLLINSKQEVTASPQYLVYKYEKLSGSGPLILILDSPEDLQCITNPWNYHLVATYYSSIQGFKCPIIEM